MRKKEIYDRLIDFFATTMPEADSELHFGNVFELLVAVVLSAQCTDKRVNMVTPALMSAFPTAEDMARASVEEIFNYIRSVSYPNSKSKHLKAMSEKIVADYGGEVPDSVEQLVSLPGVGRKTANVVTAVYYGQPNFAVDTHIYRVSERIGLTRGSKSPLQTEMELAKHFPKEIIPKAHHWLLLHGRYTCVARKPKCGQCGINDICRYFKTHKQGDAL